MNFPGKQHLIKYCVSIRMWQRGFDTQSIADHLGEPEYLIASWVANFRDVGRQEA